MTHAHQLDAHKRAAISELGLPAIEMHLSEFKFENVEQFERMLIDDTRNKQWILNPKAREIEQKLAANIEEQLAQQNAQLAERLERERQQQAALAAARLAREQDAAAALNERFRRQGQHDHQRRLEQARIDALEAAAREKPPEAPRQTLHYSLQDGGLTIRHEPGGDIFIAADNGTEQVLAMLIRLGLAYDAKRGGYPATVAALVDILPALQPYVKNVRSV